LERPNKKTRGARKDLRQRKKSVGGHCAKRIVPPKSNRLWAESSREGRSNSWIGLAEGRGKVRRMWSHPEGIPGG